MPVPDRGVFCVDIDRRRLIGVWAQADARRVAEELLPAGAVEGGFIVNRAALSAALRRLQEKLEIPSGAAAAIHIPACFASLQPLANAHGSERERVRFELDHRLLQGASKMGFDWDDIGAHCLVVAAPRSVIGERVQLLLDEGLTPVLVDVDVLGCFNAKAWTGDGVVTLIRPEWLSLLLVRDGMPWLLRTMPSNGMQEMREELTTRIGERATALIQGAEPQSPEELDALKELLPGWSSRLVAEIESILSLLIPGEREVRLGGEAALMAGLKEALAAQLPAAVHWAADDGEVETSEFPAAALAPALGLARRALELR